MASQKQPGRRPRPKGGPQADMGRVLDRLPGMERRVIEARFGLSGGHPMKASEVAELLNLTSREVQEIERRGLGRLRQVVPPERLRAALDSLARERTDGKGRR